MSMSMIVVGRLNVWKTLSLTEEVNEIINVNNLSLFFCLV